MAIVRACLPFSTPAPCPHNHGLTDHHISARAPCIHILLICPCPIRSRPLPLHKKIPASVTQHRHRRPSSPALPPHAPSCRRSSISRSPSYIPTQLTYTTYLTRVGSCSPRLPCLAFYFSSFLSFLAFSPLSPLLSSFFPSSPLRRNPLQTHLPWLMLRAFNSRRPFYYTPFTKSIRSIKWR